MDKILIFIVILLTDYSVDGQNCEESYQCVPLSQCRTVTSILYPCNDNQTYICCTSSSQEIASATVSRSSEFPDTCGMFTTSDRITNGEQATIGQFPWMALLGYKQSGIDFVQFLCGGSLITHRYVLTAAHCISIDPRLKLVVVRFGELDMETEIDCDGDSAKDKICADPYIDVPVDSVMPHENFNNKSLENDIALVRLKRKVNFTEFIQPICLPFKNDIKDEIKINGKLTVSGWGKTDSGNVAGSSVLQYTHVTVWDQRKCNISVPPRVRPIRESQLCANGVRKQDACKGDSGGPLFNTTLIEGDYRNYQIGVVSFSSAQVCGNAELPTIYTRVEYFIKWIVTNVVQ